VSLLEQVTPMDRTARDLWVAALRRTDEFPQAKGALRNEDGYCCLGVLTEVAIKAGVVMEVEVSDNGFYSYDGECEHLPDKVVEWAGLGSENPTVILTEREIDDDQDRDPDSQEEVEFVRMNDDLTWSFPKIADVIEASL
jgi:hypothetical protein